MHALASLFLHSALTLSASEGLMSAQRPQWVAAPVAFFIFSQTIFIVNLSSLASLCEWSRKAKAKTEETTLGGGSLGSCVDEERSQLRELM